jgi:hypothetical protein
MDIHDLDKLIPDEYQRTEVRLAMLKALKDAVDSSQYMPEVITKLRTWMSGEVE